MDHRKRWVEFMEKKGYKLMFPSDEVIGNQIYFSRATEPEMLTSTYEIPEVMLAEVFKPKFLPEGAFILEPKLDGKRGITMLHQGTIIQASRGRKQAKSNYPEIAAQAKVVFGVMLEKMGQGGFLQPNPATGQNELVNYNTQTAPFSLDGELYVHGTDFQTLMSATQRSVNQSENAKHLIYVVYDIIDNGTSNQLLRNQFLQIVFDDPRVSVLPNIKMIPWKVTSDKSEIGGYQDACLKDGYEGVIVRDVNAFYKQGKRIRGMLKMKKWEDEEWYICGAEKATGLHEGAVVWILNSKKDCTGLTCKGTPSTGEMGTIESRRRQYEQRKQFMGVTATIKFFERSIEGVPRFPSVIAYNRTDF